MQHQFHVVIERDENGFYIASVPQLRGCHTQAQNLDDLNERVREAITVCLHPEGGPVTELEFISGNCCPMSRAPRLTGNQLISALNRAGAFR